MCPGPADPPDLRKPLYPTGPWPVGPPAARSLVRGRGSDAMVLGRRETAVCFWSKGFREAPKPWPSPQGHPGGSVWPSREWEKGRAPGQGGKPRGGGMMAVCRDGDFPGKMEDLKHSSRLMSRLAAPGVRAPRDRFPHRRRDRGAAGRGGPWVGPGCRGSRRKGPRPWDSGAGPCRPGLHFAGPCPPLGRPSPDPPAAGA